MEEKIKLEKLISSVIMVKLKIFLVDFHYHHQKKVELIEI